MVAPEHYLYNEAHKATRISGKRTANDQDNHDISPHKTEAC